MRSKSSSRTPDLLAAIAKALSYSAFYCTPDLEQNAELRILLRCSPTPWFHISMRLTVMSQLAKSIQADDQPNLSAEIAKELERLKWNLWHGNVHKALQIVEDLEYALDLEENSQEQRKLLKAVREFGTYITANRTFIPNYGDRYRHGETISTAFVESAINQVLSKRFVKRQQMRWTERGAHLLVQVRTKVLNENWRSTLSRWYPGMEETCDAKAA